MSMHQSDYASFAAGLLGWFGQATKAGASPQAALETVALTALQAALAQMAVPTEGAPATPSTTQITP